MFLLKSGRSTIRTFKESWCKKKKMKKKQDKEMRSIVLQMQLSSLYLDGIERKREEISRLMKILIVRMDKI